MRSAKQQFLPGLLGLEARVVPSPLVSAGLAPMLHLREATSIKAPDRRVLMIDHLTNSRMAVANQAARNSHGFGRDANPFAKNAHARAHAQHKKIEPTKPGQPPGAVIDARETQAHVVFTEPYNGEQVFTFINQGTPVTKNLVSIDVPVKQPMTIVERPVWGGPVEEVINLHPGEVLEIEGYRQQLQMLDEFEFLVDHGFVDIPGNYSKYL
jgi:hypothetical protein